MATYKKVKTTKPNTDTKKSQSTTKEVFETLDVTASRSEQWLEKNQKPIFIVLAVIAALALGYLGFNKYIQEPKEIEASNELAFPKKYYEAALNGKTLESQIVERDSLLLLGLDGADGKYGFLDIADMYSGTKAGNLAEYYAGISFLRMKDYKNAISHLSNFKSNDVMLSPTAFGAIGDAFADINQLDEAFDYYMKAVDSNANEFTAPMFLHKAGIIALELGNSKKALTLFERIKKDYAQSDYAKDIAYYINKATFSIK